jgi:hypothetical protein
LAALTVAIGAIYSMRSGTFHPAAIRTLFILFT